VTAAGVAQLDRAPDYES